jgi:hypothetical protein
VLTLAVVTQVQIEHELVFASAVNKASVAAAIDRIQIGHLTNLSGGLLTGLKEQLNAATHPVPPPAGIRPEVLLFNPCIA